VDDLRHHRQRPERARADAGRQQQVGKVDGTALGCGREREAYDTFMIPGMNWTDDIGQSLKKADG
jgi:hypothetical protein